jgi:hypothetical protein
MECVEANTTIVPVPEVARLDPQRRDALEKIFGREGLESALLALRPGSILWTDDLISAEVAKSELGVERVWTQAIVEHITNCGLLDRSLADEVYAKLVGFSYQSTHFTGAVMLAALRVSNGSTTAFPMLQMVEAFKPISVTDQPVSFRLLGQFMIRLSLEPMLHETKCSVIEALFNTFPNDAVTNAQLVSFGDQCARLMMFTPLAASEFLRCLKQWRMRRLTLNPFVNP